MSNLPSYVAAAKPVPLANRAPWYKTITPTYAGVMLWFVFWESLAKGEGTPGGILVDGIWPAFLGLVIAAAICHFLFYMAPAMLGMKTGLPLYVVGTSTYGVRGGLFMPGLLMGLLQFGWLAVNAFFVSMILCKCFGVSQDVPGVYHGVTATTFVVIASFVGLKGIQYVARVATYLPLIPIVVLLVLLAMTWSGLADFNLSKLAPEATVNVTEVIDQNMVETDVAATLPSNVGMGLTQWQVIGILVTYIVGFFATAGAAGTDIAMSARNGDDVHIGGIAGIVLPTVLAGEVALLVVAGAYGADLIPAAQRGTLMDPVEMMPLILGERWANIAMIGLAISAIPGACFSAFIAANSFKTTMPKVNPWISVGLGALVAAFLAVSGWVENVISVFVVIGASFGPVCGAMLADYLLSGRKWSGPRAGFDPAGWISWFVGFVVGGFNLVAGLLNKTAWGQATFPNLGEYVNLIPVPPVSAFVVGFVLFFILALLGARSKLLEMPEAAA